MISKILRGVVLTSTLFAVSAPVVAYAATAPKTKAACKKSKKYEVGQNDEDLVKK